MKKTNELDNLFSVSNNPALILKDVKLCLFLSYDSYLSVQVIKPPLTNITTITGLELWEKKFQ
jgi:hypothetical protein